MVTSEHTPVVSPSLASTVRKVIVIVIIASFSIAAIAGIAVLLGDINADPAYQVLVTTALAGVFSVAVFCGAVLIGKPWQWFGLATIAVALITLTRLLWVVWAEPSWEHHSFEFTLTLCIVTAAVSVASLLLLLVTHRIRFIRVALFITLALLTLGVTLAIMMVYGNITNNPEEFIRFMGIVWILTALGVVVLPVASLIARGKPQPEPISAAEAQPASVVADPGPQPATPPVDAAPALSADSLARIRASARAEGVSPDELIARVFPPLSE